MTDYDPLRDRPRNRSTAANGAVVDAILDRTAASTGPDSGQPRRRSARASGATGSGAATEPAAATEPGPADRRATSPEPMGGSSRRRPPTTHADDAAVASLTPAARGTTGAEARGCLPAALLTTALARRTRDRRGRSWRSS